MSESDRLAILSGIRFELAELLHPFVTKYVPDSKHNIRTGQIDEINDLIGQYTTNQLEKVKEPEWVLIALNTIVLIGSVMTKDDPESHKLLFQSIVALIGFEAAMMLDFSNSKVGKWANAIDYVDRPIRTAVGWVNEKIDDRAARASGRLY